MIYIITCPHMGYLINQVTVTCIEIHRKAVLLNHVHLDNAATPQLGSLYDSFELFLYWWNYSPSKGIPHYSGHSDLVLRVRQLNPHY